jgi:hypothetical protein
MTTIPSAVAALKPVSVRQALLRVCNMDDPRLTVEGLALNSTQKDILYRDAGFAGKPNDRDIIRRHIDYVFSRSLAGRQDRYSKQRHALYASVKRETAEAEMRYYARSEFFNPALEREVMQFDVIEIDFRGLAARLSSLFRRFPWLKTRKALADTQEMGDLAAAFLGCLIVRSVRHPGDNGVVFRADDLKPVAMRDALKIVIIMRSSGRYTRKI